ncbi:MAG: hypothetical protein SFU25_11490 [Candidatus Caenarcaniphilales bacterium]|nr:hypothetical protein [Candidatus Caenarcaniphilales bacterium]
MSTSNSEAKVCNENTSNQFNEFYLNETIKTLSGGQKTTKAQETAQTSQSSKLQLKPVPIMITAIFIFNIVSLLNEGQMLKMLNNHSSQLKSLSGSVQALGHNYLQLQQNFNSLSSSVNERIQKEIIKFKSTASPKRASNPNPQKSLKRANRSKAPSKREIARTEREIDETKNFVSAASNEQTKRLQEIESSSLMEINSIFEKTDSKRQEYVEKAENNNFTNTNILYKERAPN